MPARRRWSSLLNSHTPDSKDFSITGADRLMPLKTPLLRVSRPVAACQRCRTAKIRCDGKLPACTACERSGRAQQCSSTNNQFAPGKERSYVATLEASVERLEKRIQEAQKRRQSTLSMLDVISPVSPPSRSATWSSPPGKPKDQKAKAREEMHAIDELVSDFGFLTVHATARDYSFGFTNSISYARLILAAATKEQLPSGMTKALPPKSATLPMVNLYVENCLSLQPIFLESEVFGALDRIYNSTDNISTTLDHWTIRMILAIICAMQSKQRGDTLYSDAVGHICEALVVADLVLHPGSIKSIQAMLLLVQYSMLDPAHFDSWTLIGAAARAMIDLGLHQDPSKSSKTSRTKLELRRRIFHCVYGLDRITSIVQMRAFAFSDDSSSVGLPFSAKKSTSSGKPGSSSGGNMWTRSNDITLAYLEFRRLQSSWYTELFQSSREPLSDPYNRIWTIHRKLSDWYAALPPSTSQHVKTYLELDLLWSYVYILSPSPRCPQTSEHAQRLLVQHAAAYAKIILAIMSSPGKVNKLSPFTFYDALRVFMVAKFYIETLTSNLDVLLSPPPRGSSLSALDADIDPLSSVHPPPLSSEGPLDRPSAALAAMSTIDSFLNALSSFEMRFGRVSNVSWRDKIQQDSQWLVAQLQQRRESETSSMNPSEQAGYFWQKPGPVAGTSNAGDTTSPPLHPVAVSQHLGTSPGRGAPGAGAYYPSPPSTGYSPNYRGQDLEVSSGSAALGQVPLWTSAASNPGSSPGMLGMNHMHQHAHAQQSQPGNAIPPMIVPQQQQPQGQVVGNAIVMPQYPNTAGFTAGEFGIGNLAAWETLPGGNMNPRFS